MAKSLQQYIADTFKDFKNRTDESGKPLYGEEAVKQGIARALGIESFEYLRSVDLSQDAKGFKEAYASAYPPETPKERAPPKAQYRSIEPGEEDPPSPPPPDVTLRHTGRPVANIEQEQEYRKLEKFATRIGGLSPEYSQVLQQQQRERIPWTRGELRGKVAEESVRQRPMDPVAMLASDVALQREWPPERTVAETHPLERMEKFPVQQLAVEGKIRGLQEQGLGGVELKQALAQQGLVPTQAIPYPGSEETSVPMRTRPASYQGSRERAAEQSLRRRPMDPTALLATDIKKQIEWGTPGASPDPGATQLHSHDGKPLRTQAQYIEKSTVEGMPGKQELVFAEYDSEGNPVVAEGEESLFFEGRIDTHPPEWMVNRFNDIEDLPGTWKDETPTGRTKFRAMKLKEKYGDNVPGWEIKRWYESIDQPGYELGGFSEGSVRLDPLKESRRAVWEGRGREMPYAYWTGQDLPTRRHGGNTERNWRHRTYLPTEEELETGVAKFRPKVITGEPPVSMQERAATTGISEAAQWATPAAWGPGGGVDPYAVRPVTTEEALKDPVLAARQQAKLRREWNPNFSLIERIEWENDPSNAGKNFEDVFPGKHPSEMLPHDLAKPYTETTGKVAGFLTGLPYGAAKGLVSLLHYAGSAAVDAGSDALWGHVLGEEAAESGEDWREGFKGREEKVGLHRFSESMEQRNQQVTELMGPSVVANFANDFDLIADVFSVLFKELAGLINSEDLNNAVTADEMLATAWKEGRLFGEEMGVGALADLAVFVERPLESIRANPAIALMQAVGLGKAMYHTLDPNSHLARGIKYLDKKAKNAVSSGLGRFRTGTRLALLKAFGDATAAHNADTAAFLHGHQRAAHQASDTPVIKDSDRDFSVITDEEKGFLSEYQQRREDKEMPPLSPEEARDVLVQYRQFKREGEGAGPVVPEAGVVQPEIFGDKPTPLSERPELVTGYREKVGGGTWESLYREMTGREMALDNAEDVVRWFNENVDNVVEGSPRGVSERVFAAFSENPKYELGGGDSATLTKGSIDEILTEHANATSQSAARVKALEATEGYGEPFGRKWEIVADAEKRLGRELSPDEISDLMEMHARKGVRVKEERVSKEKQAQLARSRADAANRAANAHILDDPKLVQEQAVLQVLRGEELPRLLKDRLNKEQIAILDRLAERVKDFPGPPKGAESADLLSMWFEAQVRQPSVLTEDAAKMARVVMGIDFEDIVSRKTRTDPRSVTKMGESARDDAWSAIGDLNLLIAEIMESPDSAKIIKTINRTVPEIDGKKAWDYLHEKRDLLIDRSKRGLKESTEKYNAADTIVAQARAGFAELDAAKKSLKDRAAKGQQIYSNEVAGLIPKLDADGKIVLGTSLENAIKSLVSYSTKKKKVFDREGNKVLDKKGKQKTREATPIKEGRAKAIKGFELLNAIRVNGKGWAELTLKERNAAVRELKDRAKIGAVTDGGASLDLYNINVALRALREQGRKAALAMKAKPLDKSRKALQEAEQRAAKLETEMDRWQAVVDDSSKKGKKIQGAFGDRMLRFQRKVDEQYGAEVRREARGGWDKAPSQEQKLRAIKGEPWSVKELDVEGRPIVELSGFGPVRTPVGRAVQRVMAGKDPLTPKELYDLIEKEIAGKAEYFKDPAFKGQVPDSLEGVDLWVQSWRPGEGKVSLSRDMSAKEMAAMHPGLVAHEGRVHMAGNYIDDLSASEVYKQLGEKASRHKPDAIEAELLEENNVITILNQRIKDKPQEAAQLSDVITSDIVSQEGLFDAPFSTSTQAVDAAQAATVGFNARSAAMKQTRRRQAEDQFSMDVTFSDGQFRLPVIVGSAERLAQRIDEVAAEAGVAGTRVHKRARARVLGEKDSGQGTVVGALRERSPVLSEQGPMTYVKVDPDSELIPYLGLSRKNSKVLAKTDGVVSFDADGAVIIKPDSGNAHHVLVPEGEDVIVKEGQLVKAGDPLSSGRKVIALSNGRTLSDIYMPLEMKKRLEFYQKYDKAMSDPLGKLGGFYAWSKANMAPRSIASHTYNFVSNVMLNLVRTGDLLTPVKLYRSWDDLTRYRSGQRLRIEEKFDKWAKGRDLNDPKVLAKVDEWRGRIAHEKEVEKILVASGVIDSKILETEYLRPTEVNLKGKFKDSWIGQYFATLEDVYGKADTPFKVMEARRVIEKQLSYFNRLKNGEYIQSRVSPTRQVRLSVGNDGRRYAQGVSFGETTGWRLIGKKKPVSKEAMHRTIGGFARYSAGLMFVNYDEVGMANMFQRMGAGNGLTGLLNVPYISYTMASSYIPGVKKGVQGSLINPNGRMKTNSKSIGRSVAADEAKTWLQRQWVFSAAARNDSTEPGAEMLSFMMSQYKLKDRKDMAAFWLNPAGPNAVFLIPTSRVSVSGSTKTLFNVLDDVTAPIIDPIAQHIGLAKTEGELRDMIAEADSNLKQEAVTSGIKSSGYKAIERHRQDTYRALAKTLLRKKRGGGATVSSALEFANLTGQNFMTAALDAFREVEKGGSAGYVLEGALKKLVPMIITPTLNSAVASPIAVAIAKSSIKNTERLSGSKIRAELTRKYGRAPNGEEMFAALQEARDQSGAREIASLLKVMSPSYREGSLESKIDTPVVSRIFNTMARAYTGVTFYQMDIRPKAAQAYLDRTKKSLIRGFMEASQNAVIERDIEKERSKPKPDYLMIEGWKRMLEANDLFKKVFKREVSNVFNSIVESVGPTLWELMEKKGTWGDKGGAGERKRLMGEIKKRKREGTPQGLMP